MTRCFDVSGRIARDLLSFHQEIPWCRAIHSPYWRAVGAFSLLRRAALVEHDLGRSPAHETSLCVALLAPSLAGGEAAAEGLRSYLPRVHAEPWLIDILKGRIERSLGVDRRPDAPELFAPGGDPFLLDLAGLLGASGRASDLPTLCALLARGQLAAAQAVASRLAGGDRQEALARLAAARVAAGAAAEDVWHFHGLKDRSHLRRARLAVVTALLSAGRTCEALAALDGLEGAAERALGAAVAAERLHEQGFCDQARQLLAQRRGCGARGALLEIRWQIEGEGGQRERARREARARLLEATRELGDPRRDERDEARLHPVFPGLWPVAPGLEARLLELVLRLNDDPSARLDVELFRLAPLPRQALARCGEARAWLAQRLRALEARRGAPLDRGSGKPGCVARALLCEAPQPIFSAETASRLEAMKALVEGALGGRWEEARRTGRHGDARSDLRAAFDEGVSLGPERRAHRRALAQVCRRVLIDSQRGVGDASEAAVEARVRCLLQLEVEGIDAASILAEALGALDAPRGVPRGTGAIFAGLCRVAPRKARELFFTRFAALDRAASKELFDEAKRLLPGQLLGAIQALLVHLVMGRGRPRARALAWVGDLLAGWWSERGSPPPADLVTLLIEELKEAPRARLPRPRPLLLELSSLLGQLVAQPFDGILRALAGEQAAQATLSVLSISGFAEPEPRWPLASWQAAARRLLEGTGHAPPGLVRRWCARLAPGRGDLPARLLRGEAPVDLPREIELGSGYQLCWLDKSRDFLAFVRFADCVPCCFHSNSSSYRAAMDTQRAILSLWRDPFSFCLRVQRRDDGGESRAEGFVFGSFGLSDRGPVALLNGLYLRRQVASLRKAILEAIEEHLARPLGLALLGVAARYGGRGTMPPGYECGAEFGVRRLRALIEPSGALASRTYDDLALPPNQETRATASLYWKTMAPG